MTLTCVFSWSQQQESNPQPTDYKSVALPLSHAGAFGYFIGKFLFKLELFFEMVRLALLALVALVLLAAQRKCDTT